MYRLEPTCTKTMKPAGYFDEKKCFENKFTMKENQTKQETRPREESSTQAEVQTKICKGCRKIMTQKKNPLDSLGPKGPAGEDARDVFLRSIPDHMPINELAKRGWRGHLTREESIIVGPISQEA